MLKWYQWYVIGRFCNLFCLLHCRNWKSMALMSVCNCVISVKKCFLSPNNGFLRFCQGKTQVPIKNYILNSTNRITTVLCQKCLAQQAHIIRASTLHPSSTILLLSYIFLCEQKISIAVSLRYLRQNQCIWITIDQDNTSYTTSIQISNSLFPWFDDRLHAQLSIYLAL